MTNSDATSSWEFSYDANGLRTQRTDYNHYNYYYGAYEHYEYQYDSSGRLIYMDHMGDTMYFSYDPVTGFPQTMIRYGMVFYYVTNSRGDVMAILDDSGNYCAVYEYDAWGNVLYASDCNDWIIAEYNPLLYRGYIYDWETGLYYLQSRYYDPEIGRFINADGLVSTGQGLTGNNMCAYCGNNPIIYSDPYGLWTMGFNIGGNITFGVGASVSIGIFWDDDGNIDWQWSYAVAGVNNTNTIGAVDAGVGLAFQYTNRDTVYDLYGPATYVGASGGPSWYVGGDVITFADASDPEASIDGFQITGGIGIGVDVHVVESDTKPVRSQPKSSRDILTFKEKLMVRR